LTAAADAIVDEKSQVKDCDCSGKLLDEKGQVKDGD
jgi:hypothetical protein